MAESKSMDEYRVERILRCCECIPPGRMATYSLVGRVTGEPARLVGRVMAQYGSNVAWWRVVNVRGELPADIAARARRHWDDESIVYHGLRVQMSTQLVDEDLLARDYRASTADLMPIPARDAQ